MTSFRNLAIVSASLAALLGFAETASATTWQQQHPRRVEVNHRLNNENARIAKAEASGKLTPMQAIQLDREDYKIRQEERFMASSNGTHITKAEQKALNQQENQLSKQIP